MAFIKRNISRLGLPLVGKLNTLARAGHLISRLGAPLTHNGKLAYRVAGLIQLPDQTGSVRSNIVVACIDHSSSSFAVHLSSNCITCCCNYAQILMICQIAPRASYMEAG